MSYVKEKRKCLHQSHESQSHGQREYALPYAHHRRNGSIFAWNKHGDWGEFRTCIIIILSLRMIVITLELDGEGSFAVRIKIRKVKIGLS